MPARDQWKTADEILSNPDTNRVQDRLRAKVRSLRQRGLDDIAPVLCELSDLGYQADNFEDLIKRHCPLPDDVVSILLSWVNQLTMTQTQSSLVRALGAAAAPFDGRPLKKCFETAGTEGLKWAIANTIALTHPLHIDDWISELRQNDYWNQTLIDLGFNKRRRKT